MDVNGTRHRLLLGQDDWAACESPGTLTWSYNQARESVGLETLVFTFPQPQGDRALTLADRRGAARDSYGHWYWIGADRQSIRVRWSEALAAAHYWSAADPRACLNTPAGRFAPKEEQAPADEQLAGLAVTSGHYLVVGSPERESLLIFDLLSGGAAPLRIALPTFAGATPFVFEGERFDIAPLLNGGFVVLDRKYKLIWVFDATIRPDPLRPERSPEALLFQPKTGPQRLRLPAGDSQPILLADADTPISVEPLPDGTLLVLDRAALDAATVRRYERHGGPALASVELREPSLRDLGAPPLIGAGRELAIQAHDFAFVPRQGSGESLGTLFVVNPGGNQAFALEVLPGGGLKLRLLRAYYPLRGYTGKALVAPPGEASAFFDQDERWLPVISLDRPRYEPSGTLDVPILDGREPGCVWHRLCLDACIPPETTVRVLTRSADTEDLIAWQPWREEPSLYLRGGGAELPYYQLWSQDELRQPHVGTWALLFQRAHGRYLAVRLVLEGNGRSTPCIRALRAHYPRFSYLSNYLPGLYQDDAVSASFLDRFLANPEGLLTTLEGQIAEAQVFWDARTAPAEALEWLAGWLGIALDPAWSEHRRRLLIAYAPVFFLRRGTLTGLAQAIRLATDDQPGPEIFQDEYDDRCSPVRIVERFRTRRVPGVVVGDPDDQTGPSGSILAVARERAHRFVVLLPAATSDTQVALVERLAELEKPAHTFVVVKRYWALFRTGEARVGLDTRLGEGGRFELLRLGETALAEGMLGARHPFDLTGRTVLGV